MSWEPRHDKLYIDGVLIRHKVQRTPNGEWEDYVPEEPPPVKKAHMKAFPNLDFHKLNQGMDLRDYFAAKAMQGLIYHFDFARFKDDPLRVARWAYDAADAMMKARGENSA